ncbi:ABC transporter permease [Tellurirhabdus bombi]|uniref:ABC transporter permease n=1 Tax=Tellurirhabdus bombi TaxID=2907205 RepID=UPI001F2B44AB|nr:ABC transporter permease [Tellurirhabdus bombi]
MLLNYIKIAWKVLLRHPFYTFITLFGISLTLTVLIVMTSFVDHLIGSHYPEYKRDRMLYIQRVVRQDSAQQGRNMGPVSFSFLTKYVKTLKTPERVGIASAFGFANAYVRDRRISLQTKVTDADFWQVTDFEFLEGKPFNEQNIANGDHVAVITDDIKRQYFDDPTQPVVGKNIEVDNVNYRIIGVLKGAPVTRLYTSADIYFPYTIPKSNYKDSGFGGQYIAFLLAHKEEDIPKIQAEFNDAVRRIPLPQVDNGFKVYHLEVSANNYLGSLLSTFPFLSGNDKGYFYLVLGLFMLLFMSLPAINLVNLNVSRIMERASEIGVRKAFGAPTLILMGQFIIENLFITAIGGAIALALSALVIYFINQSGWIAKADLTVNLPVFAISLLVSFVFGLLSGLVPALRMSKLTIVEALKA